MPQTHANFGIGTLVFDRILHAWLRYSAKPGKGSEDKPDRANHHEAQEKIDQAERESALKGVRNEHLQFSSVAAAASLSAGTFSTCISFSACTPVSYYALCGQ